MVVKETSTGPGNVSPAEMLAGELVRGSRLAVGLDRRVYGSVPGRTGSIGAHIRHNLDLVECFLRGFGEGEVDYTTRSRDGLVETDAQAAAERTRSLVNGLAAVEGRENESVLVRSEIDRRILHNSTVGRELEFLYSHTVHHHALISERLKALGVQTDESFGVAPSTLRFWRNEAANAGR